MSRTVPLSVVRPTFSSLMNSRTKISTQRRNMKSYNQHTARSAPTREHGNVYLLPRHCIALHTVFFCRTCTSFYIYDYPLSQLPQGLVVVICPSISAYDDRSIASDSTIGSSVRADPSERRSIAQTPSSLLRFFRLFPCQMYGSL